MKPHVRRTLAFIAGRLIGGGSQNSIYDHSTLSRVSISANLVGDSVRIYDHSESCQITGLGNIGRFKLFHHGESSEISLDIVGDEFKGFDHGTSSYFSGMVREGTVRMFDGEVGEHFIYDL